MNPGQLFFVVQLGLVHLKSLLIRCTQKPPLQAKDKIRRVGPKIAINHRGLKIATSTTAFAPIRDLFGCRIAPFDPRVVGFGGVDIMGTKSVNSFQEKDLIR